MTKFKYLLCCGILNAAASFSGILGLQIQFLVVSLVFFLGGIFLLPYNPFKRKYLGYLYLFGPFSLLLLIAFISSFYVDGFLGYPLVLYTSFTIVFTIYMWKIRSRIAYIISYLILTIVLTLFLPNFYHYISHIRQDQSAVNTSIKDFEVYDSSHKKVDLKALNKIIILDVWDSSCGVCIKQFPKFEKLSNEFKNDPEIAFYSLNLPLKRDDRNQVAAYTNPYSFNKLYAGPKVREQLKINLIPKYIIIDKESKVRYIGSLNDGKFDYYKNFYNILAEIK